MKKPPASIRLITYLGLQIVLLAAPAILALPVFMLIIIWGRLEGMRWSGFFRAWPVLIIALAPAIFGFPYGSAALGGAATLRAWLPSLFASSRLITMFASAMWLSAGISPLELMTVLENWLKPFGRRVALRVSRAASLALAFIPWTLREMRLASQAARQRGIRFSARPFLFLSSMAVPVTVRALEKARLSGEALSIRDSADQGW